MSNNRRENVAASRAAAAAAAATATATIPTIASQRSPTTTSTSTSTGTSGTATTSNSGRSGTATTSNSGNSSRRLAAVKGDGDIVAAVGSENESTGVGKVRVEELSYLGQMIFTELDDYEKLRFEADTVGAALYEAYGL
eukprot:Filipodium_phascolosomae@DN1063_c0_g1_i1.p1